MAQPEHISAPIRRVLEVFYDPVKRDWDEVADRELARLGIRPDQVKVIICYPNDYKIKIDKDQLNLFDDYDHD